MPGMGAFVPRVFADEACLLGVDFGRFATNTKGCRVGSLNPLVLVVQFPFGGSSSSGILWFLVLEALKSSMSDDALAYGQLLLHPVQRQQRTSVSMRCSRRRPLLLQTC